MNEEDYIDPYELAYRRDIEEHFEMTKDLDLSSYENSFAWRWRDSNLPKEENDQPSPPKDPLTVKIEERIKEWKKLIEK